jgi:hypothetical protein
VFIPIFFFASIYAQVSLGDGPQEAGLYLLVFFLGFAPGVQLGGRVLDNRGAKEVVVAGCVIAAIGLTLWAGSVTRLSLGSQWYYILIAGFGMGMMVGPSNTDAINQVGRLSYGEATGVTQTTRNFGASFGLAALGTLLVTVERNHLTSRLRNLGLRPAAAHSAAQKLSTTRQSGTPAGVPASAAAHAYHAAQLSVANGMQAVLYAMGGVMAVAAIVAAAGLRRGIHAAGDSERPGATAGDAAAPEPRRAGAGEAI